MSNCILKSLLYINNIFFTIACGPPPQIPNAILDPSGDSLLGSVRKYKCMTDYIATGPIEIGCIRGTGGPLWTSPEFQCISKY